MLPDPEMLKLGLSCKCPRCREGDLYRPGFTLSLNDKCGACGLDLAANDSGDGPAVFLIFILGFTLVPLALAVEFTFHPPLWLHIFVWGGVMLAVVFSALRPLKAYIIALQFKHRPGEWGKR